MTSIPSVRREIGNEEREFLESDFDDFSEEQGTGGGNTEEYGAEAFKHVRRIRSSFPILLSCRQIYHEAVGLLYGAGWLERTGSEFDLLTKVVIEIDTLYPEGCMDLGYSNNGLDILPLVRVI